MEACQVGCIGCKLCEKLQALKVYVNIQNLKTWKHNTGYTPELGGTATAFGVDNGSYPVPAVYTFGINLTF